MVLLDFSITPLGRGENVSQYVTRCIRIIDNSGLDYHLHAMGTTIEGELDDVLGVLAACFRELEGGGWRGAGFGLGDSHGL